MNVGSMNEIRTLVSLLSGTIFPLIDVFYGIIRMCCVEKKSVFIKNWFDKGVIFVLDLLKKDGNFYSYSEFSELSEVDISPRVYEWVINSISPKLLHLVRENCYRSLKCEMPNNFIGGLELCNIKCNNFWIRKTLIKKFSCHPKAFYKWKRNYPFLSIKIWAGINTFMLPNKMKELHYKILHMYYPCNSLLSKFKLDISSQCTFCNSNLETIITHLFFECDHAKDLWQEMSWLVFSAYNKLFSFEIINVLFLIWESGSKELDDLLKRLTLCGLFHLHKCKVTDCMPNFRIFCIDLKLFYESLLIT